MTTGDSGSLVSVAARIDGVLQGSIMTTMAVLAVAGVGFAMLSGRRSLRRSSLVVVGCFIAFGAPAIAKVLIGLAQDQALAPAVDPELLEAAPLTIDSPPAAAAPLNIDPYAGASVPG